VSFVVALLLTLEVHFDVVAGVEADEVAETGPAVRVRAQYGAAKARGKNGSKRMGNIVIIVQVSVKGKES
jgi:hypothetical protein